MKYFVRAVVFGLVLYAAIIWINQATFSALVPNPEAPPDWHWAYTITNIIALLAMVLPGIVAGIFSRAKGFVSGALTGLLSHILFSGILSFNSLAIFTDFESSMLFASGLLQPIVLGAVAGGAGELMATKIGL